MPYVKARYTEKQGNYEYADSMLIITKDSAYEACVLIIMALVLINALIIQNW